MFKTPRQIEKKGREAWVSSGSKGLSWQQTLNSLERPEVSRLPFRYLTPRQIENNAYFKTHRYLKGKYIYEGYSKNMKAEDGTAVYNLGNDCGYVFVDKKWAMFSSTHDSI